MAKVLGQNGKLVNIDTAPVDHGENIVSSGAIFDALTNPFDTRAKLLNVYKKVLNGADYSSGITAVRGDAHLRMAVFGDSIGGDVTFPIYNKLRSMFGFGGAIFGQPTLTGGAVTRSDVGVTTYWFNGNWHEINGAGSLTFFSGGARMACSVIKIYYIKEPGAGSFQVQLDNGTGFVDEGSVVDTNDVLGSGIITITKTANNYSIRINQVSGNVKIIMCVGLNELVGQDSLAFLNLAVGGLQWTNANATSRAITNPVFADLGIDLASILFKETGTIYSSINPWLLDFKVQSPNTDWVLISAGPQSSGDDLNKADNEALRTIAYVNNWIFFDWYKMLKDWATVNAAGLGGDGVHLSKIAGYIGAGALWRILGFDSFCLIGSPIASDKLGWARMVDGKGIAWKGTNNASGNFMSIECSGSGDLLIKANRWLDFRNLAGTQLFNIDQFGNIQQYTALARFKPLASSGAMISGTAVLINGEAVVNSTAVTSGSKILVTLNTAIGTLGVHYMVKDADRVTGVSFTIKSVNSAGATVTTDLSNVNWLIMN